MSDTGPVAAYTIRRHAARPHRTRGQHRASWAAELTPLLAGTQRRYTAVVGSAVAGASVVAMAATAGLPAEEPREGASQAVSDIAALAAEASAPEQAAPGTTGATGTADPAAAPAPDGPGEVAPAVEPARTSPVTAQDAQVKWTPMLDRITITSLFGQRWGRNHNGVDFDAETGDPVYAAYPGTVVYAGWESGFGNLVVIDHGDGVETYYAHNSEVVVAPGDQVEGGGQIANAGNTGHSFGSHVHFEVHVGGQPVEPLNYLAESGLDLR
ncbi:M23 family metallopeptidase [Glycomyces sp. A-F 0318]|uniref:M23 family metallopeptidase n=1 Tax=Glycomyces amatae TaxID=2881355 RepID=UPI001E3806A4|nr:M23 family metallopeptidase [Glycomyces amatae]MCD0445587.1 M23 family metallopeptidase [Glycomyces amatae]